MLQMHVDVCSLSFLKSLCFWNYSPINTTDASLPSRFAFRVRFIHFYFGVFGCVWYCIFCLPLNCFLSDKSVSFTIQLDLNTSQSTGLRIRLAWFKIASTPGLKGNVKRCVIMHLLGWICATAVLAAVSGKNNKFKLFYQFKW